MIFLVILSLSTAISAITLEEVQNNNEAKLANNLNEVIQFVASFHSKPYTVATPVFENQDSNSDLLQLEMFRNSHPFVCGLISKEIRRLHYPLTSFINIIELKDNNVTAIAQIIAMLKSTTNKRKDFYIFSASATILETVFSNPVTHQLRSTMGFIRDTGEILAQPLVLTGKMTLLKNVQELQSHYETFPSIGGNLRGQHLRTTTTVLPPWGDLNGKELDGSHYRVVKSSSEYFNFSFEVNMQPTRSYANILPNGTWDGMASDIIYPERNFDMAIYLGHAYPWYHLLDFVGPLGFANLQFLTAKPQSNIKWQAFFYPYQDTVWMSILGTYVIVVFTLIVFMFLTPNFGNRSIMSAIYVPYALSVEQSILIPKGFRSVSVLWMIFIIVVGTGYKSNLVSYLSFPQSDVIPTNYYELSKMTDYIPILNNIGVVESEFFKTSTSPVVSSIKKRLRYQPDTPECLRKTLLTKKHICLAWDPFIQFAAARSLTLNLLYDPLVYSKDTALPVSMSLGFVKDSIYVDAFLPISSILYETGHIGKWETEMIYRTKKLGKEEMIADKKSEIYKTLSQIISTGQQNNFKPLSMKNLLIVFSIFILGIIISAVCLFIEIAHKFGTELISRICRRIKQSNHNTNNEQKFIHVKKSSPSSALGQI